MKKKYLAGRGVTEDLPSSVVSLKATIKDNLKFLFMINKTEALGIHDRQGIG